MGAPASQRRAPLRRQFGRVPARTRSPCSRLSTAGSIAACALSVRRLRAFGAPASQRRAPLRQLLREWRRDHGWVLPPFNGGLHCGGIRRTARHDQGIGRAPAFQRRAPLRHRLRRRGQLENQRAPASQRRAPLRLLLIARVLRRSTVTCSRLSTAGSIAADAVAQAGVKDLRRAPASQRRAPLRRDGRDVDNVINSVSCSRLSTAGSIAAIILTPTVLGLALCSRLSTAGSIAACTRVNRLSARAPGCSRLSTAGSIAARQPRWITMRGGALRAVLPPLNGGLHCGSRCSRSLDSGPGETVLPPLNGGLHCGIYSDPALNSTQRCSRLSTGAACDSRAVLVAVPPGSRLQPRRRRWPAPHLERRDRSTGQTPGSSIDEDAESMVVMYPSA